MRPSWITIEDQIFNLQTKTKSIYIVVVLAIFVAFISLPFIKIHLSVSAPGIIRPNEENTNISSIKSGVISKLYIQEGSSVKKGDTLIKLNTEHIVQEINLIQSEINKRLALIKDLNLLCNYKNSRPDSQVLLHEYRLFKSQINQIELKLFKAKSEVDRNKHLYEEGLIAAKVFDDLEYDYQSLIQENEVLQKNQISKWKTDRIQFDNELCELKNRLDNKYEELRTSHIIAPKSGTIIDFSGIYEQNNIMAGQELFMISPSSELIAEIFVSTQDIGHILSGQDANIQVDAYNYNHWGQIKAMVESISEDYILINNTPMYKVKCKLESNSLQLENGAIGKIQKGMTVNARFLISKHSLLDMLYKEADELFNPSRL